ncbi:MAG: penicillin-binding protein activator [Bdellovibrionales bacterium]
MFRRSWPCAVLAAFLLMGCDSIQQPFSTQQSTLSTPQTQESPARQRGVIDSAAARRAGSPYAPTAQSSITPPTQETQPNLIQPPREAKIGLLVPLSGRSAPLGQAMVNAAQLAVFDVGIQGFELMPRDSKGTSEGAIQATQDLITKGAQLIVGPLFAADVAAVKPFVQSAHINMLALSTDISLAAPGAYVMGFAPAPQVDRIVDYAVKQGLHSFAALIPSGPYGQLVAKEFEQAILSHKATLVTSQPLSNLAAIIEQKDAIDALFLPLGGGELRSTVAQLEAADFQPGHVRLLGTGLWDEPNLAQDHILLMGGWFAAPEPQTREHFLQSYQDTYGQKPPRLATLAYDATALAAVLARSGMTYDESSLTLPAGFAGLDGLFRLKANGQIERGLAVLEVGDTENRVIDPSPTSFARP